MFRFENLEIWKRSIEVTDRLFDLADTFEAKHHYRFADQLRGASLSISNNIAEGSGSSSKKDFTKFLNYTHRSIFETVNMLIIASRRAFADPSRAVGRQKTWTAPYQSTSISQRPVH